MRYQRNLMIVVTSIAIGCTVAIAVSIQKVRKRSELAQQVKKTTLKAQAGDQLSEVALSRMYYYGSGLPQSYSEAFLWSSKAADREMRRRSMTSEYYTNEVEVCRKTYRRRSTGIRGQRFRARVGRGNLGSLYYQGHGLEKIQRRPLVGTGKPPITE